MENQHILRVHTMYSPKSIVSVDSSPPFPFFPDVSSDVGDCFPCAASPSCTGVTPAASASASADFEASSAAEVAGDEDDDETELFVSCRALPDFTFSKYDTSMLSFGFANAMRGRTSLTNSLCA